MTRILLVLILAAGTTGASAANWPWQKKSDDSLPYCQGFVVGGLASNQVEGVARTDLWLAWNYIIRSGGVDHTGASDEFNSGRAQFNDSVDAAAQQALLDDANGTCGLGRSGHQVTGW